MNYCKFKNVKLIAIDNPNISLIVFHHRYEELIEGCLRVATQYRFQNTPCFIKFHIERDGTFLFNETGGKIVI
jgi:hypothetical protein